MVSASPKFTVEQLHKMVKAGEHPPQGYMLDWEKRNIPFDFYRDSSGKTRSPFDACKLAANEVVAPFRAKFPVAIVFDDTRMFLIKAWTSEGITVAICNHLDFSFIVSKYDYRK